MAPDLRGVEGALGVVFGLGGLLVVLAVLHAVGPETAHHPVDNLLELVLLGGPAVGVLGVGYWGVRAAIDDDCLPKLVYWAVGSAALLFGVGCVLVFYFELPFGSHDALFVYHFGAALGAFGGCFVGFHEARAITRAQEVELTQEQRDRLERLNHLLRHDLLNDLAVIDGYVELLVGTVDDEAALDRLETIRRQNERAMELIENVRVLVRASRYGRSLEPVDLAATIEGELTHLRDVHPEATVTVDSPEGVSVRADDLLGSVFENLIRNALQHNDAAHPRVSVSAGVEGDTVTVAVADNGPGIPGEIRGDLFSPPEDGAHGFGLYLVRTLVERYGGTVAVTDTGPGGTTVEIGLERAG